MPAEPAFGDIWHVNAVLGPEPRLVISSRRHLRDGSGNVLTLPVYRRDDTMAKVIHPRRLFTVPGTGVADLGVIETLNVASLTKPHTKIDPGFHEELVFRVGQMIGP
ncbi:hypothetical protein ACQP2K_31655 [Microbispora siamensis]